MENASYPVGICAERCALATAVVSGVFVRCLRVKRKGGERTGEKGEGKGARDVGRSEGICIGVEKRRWFRRWVGSSCLVTLYQTALVFLFFGFSNPYPQINAHDERASSPTTTLSTIPNSECTQIYDEDYIADG